MEQRLANSWRMTLNEKKFIETTLLADLRIDGRGPFDYRNITIKFGREDGSSEVQLGQTRAMGFVTSQLVQPFRDRPNEGTLSIYTEFSPMADPSFELGRPGENAVELGRIIDRGLRESRAVDTESLCVVAGRWVWSIRIDIHILDNGGNLVDAANVAALAALLTFRRPECTLDGENGHDVIVHPPEVREPLPLIVHHLPVAITFAFIGLESIVVIDPSHFEEAVMGGKLTATLNSNGDVCAVQKAGGEGVMQSVILQCLRIAAVKAADITSKIKRAVESYTSERTLRKIKRLPNPVVDAIEFDGKDVDILSEEMERTKMKTEEQTVHQSSVTGIETLSSKRIGFNLREGKTKCVIDGPSNWDPYSRGISADLLKDTSASQVVLNAVEKAEILPSVMPQLTLSGQSPVEINPAPLSQEMAKSRDQISTFKTLKDAVKPKHKRKKLLANKDGSR